MRSLFRHFNSSPAVNRLTVKLCIHCPLLPRQFKQFFDLGQRLIAHAAAINVPTPLNALVLDACDHRAWPIDHAARAPCDLQIQTARDRAAGRRVERIDHVGGPALRP